MYKIYINETPLFLCTLEEVDKLGPASEQILSVPYSGKKKYFNHIFDMLDKTDRFERVVVFSKNLDKMWEDFCSLFHLIGAAGGAVTNPDGQYLLIFRRGFWDLPKGKIDKGETPPLAALREVEEETGLTHLQLGEHLLDTWHTYQLDGKRILKTTYWFSMKTTQNDLTPQTEEDIEQAVWMELDTFLQKPHKVYGNILDVLQKAKSLNTNG
ncbi:MAG: NUDIX domain-containing protein [Saprospiraceae bacterium]